MGVVAQAKPDLVPSIACFVVSQEPLNKSIGKKLSKTIQQPLYNKNYNSDIRLRSFYNYWWNREIRILPSVGASGVMYTPNHCLARA